MTEGTSFTMADLRRELRKLDHKLLIVHPDQEAAVRKMLARRPYSEAAFEIRVNSYVIPGNVYVIDKNFPVLEPTIRRFRTGP